MLATSHSHDTTVRLPDVSAPVVAAVVARMLADEPQATVRIQRAVSILFSGALHATAACGVYAVDGCEGRRYETTSLRCTCPDAVTRQLVCKHSWAACLLSALSAEAAAQRMEDRWLLTEKAEQALAAL